MVYGAEYAMPKKILKLTIFITMGICQSSYFLSFLLKIERYINENYFPAKILKR